MVTTLFRKIREKLNRFTAKEEHRQPSRKPNPKPEQQPAVMDAPANAGAPQTRNPKRRPGRRRKKKPRTESAAPTASQESASADSWSIDAFKVSPAEGKVRFHDLALPQPVMHAIHDVGFQYCSPIQAEILPATLAGKDAVGQAQTGTGKTAAFLITIITHLLKNPSEENRASGTPKALVLAPTRELAIQITEEASLLAKYTPIRVMTIYGGTEYQKQRQRIETEVIDIVVATPGRLIDFCQYDDVNLGEVEILVIDEADRMLDMGFIPQVRRLVRKTPFKDKRQTMLFSATITGDVERLTTQWTQSPVTVEIEPEQVEVASVEQIVYLTTTREKFALLYSIITRQQLKRVIIFCNRRDETQRVANLLQRYQVSCAVISGEIPQKKRMRTLEDFRAGSIQVLVATDVAGRGLHIEGVSHVINYSLPHEPENYVHRIGRTGRAGATGISVSFACEEDSFYIPAIEEFLGHELACTTPEPEWLKLPPAPKGAGKKAAAGKPRKPRKRRRRPPRKRTG